MLPAANPSVGPARHSQPTPHHTAQNAAQPQSSQTARASAGETGAANLRAETAQPVQAAEQSALPARLRDRETFENTERDPPESLPAGPTPAFEESPLERQARTAFDPPPRAAPLDDTDAQTEKTDRPPSDSADAPAPISHTPTTRAEASFAETREIAEPREPASVDVAR